MHRNVSYELCCEQLCGMCRGVQQPWTEAFSGCCSWQKAGNAADEAPTSLLQPASSIPRPRMPTQNLTLWTHLSGGLALHADASHQSSITHLQHGAGCVQGVPEFCLIRNLCPELGVPNCATTSEPLNPPLRNQSSTWAACPYSLC